MQPDTDLEASHLKRPFAQQRRRSPQKQDQRGAKHTHNQTQRQIPQSHLFIWPRSANKQSWSHANEPLLVFDGSLHSFDSWVRSDMAACYTSGCGERGRQQSARTHTHTHTAVLQCPFLEVSILLHVKTTTICDIVRQRQVGGVQTAWWEGWMQIIWDQDTFRAFVWLYRHAITIEPWALWFRNIFYIPSWMVTLIYFLLF